MDIQITINVCKQCFARKFCILDKCRNHPEFRTALARCLDMTIVQLGDMYRMLAECEYILEIINQERGQI